MRANQAYMLTRAQTVLAMGAGARGVVLCEWSCMVEGGRGHMEKSKWPDSDEDRPGNCGGRLAGLHAACA